MKKTCIAYPNLRAEMARSNITIQEIARALGISRETASKKLSKKSPLKLDEAFEIANLFPMHDDVLYLFCELQNSA